jgi:hypothetical protein
VEIGELRWEKDIFFKQDTFVFVELSHDTFTFLTKNVLFLRKDIVILACHRV